MLGVHREVQAAHMVSNFHQQCNMTLFKTTQDVHQQGTQQTDTQNLHQTEN
jgi:hypothetical protein